MPLDRYDYGLAPLEIRIVGAIVDAGAGATREIIRERVDSQSRRFMKTENTFSIIRRLEVGGFIQADYSEGIRNRSYIVTESGWRALEQAATYHGFYGAIATRALTRRGS